MELARRTVLTAGLVMVVGGCSGRATPAGSGLTTAPPIATPAPVTTTPALTVPVVPRWRPSVGDREPACKSAAVAAVVQAGTGRDRAIEVIDAQYGGLLTDMASVLVVTRSWRITQGHLVRGGATFDVRLTRSGARWRVTDVYPSRPGAPEQPSSAARRVLADDRIHLPPAARRDIESGSVHDAPLLALSALAREFRIGISVVRSGHPVHVFGTTRLSDHPRGRAFDTWQLEGKSVVDPRTSRQLVTEYMHAVASHGSYNVGGPYLLGSAPQWFSDNTHHDHVHAGFLS